VNVAPPPRAATDPHAQKRDRLRIITLIVGDALAFLVFAALGRGQHHEPTAFAALGQTALTAVPFALGWFLVAPWLAAFSRARTGAVGQMLRTTLLAWLAAWPATLLLRWAFTGRVPPVAFAAVILLANAVLLAAWRGAFALWEGRAQRARSGGPYPLKR
jgi:hypothetical protein